MYASRITAKTRWGMGRLIGRKLKHPPTQNSYNPSLQRPPPQKKKKKKKVFNIKYRNTK